MVYLLDTAGLGGMAKGHDIVDIAELAKVSVSTVSRVLNQRPDVSPGTRTRVMELIERCGYVPNNSARNLKRQSLRAIGVVVKGFTNPFFTPMLDLIQTELTAEGYSMLLEPVDPAADELAAALALNKEKKPRGLIFLGGVTRRSEESFALLDIPWVMATVTLDKCVPKERYSSVSVDDYREAYKAGVFACRNGHRDFALIGSAPGDKSISFLRIAGFKDAIRKNGGRCPALNTGWAGDFSPEGGYRAARGLLEKGADFSCLLCAADTMALGAIRAVFDLGRGVPGDVSVIGFDGIEAGRFSVPTLATVRQPREKMVRRSVEILLRQLRPGASHEHELFEAVFVEGESFLPRA
jgi:LacI family transcriptional regulator